MFYYIRPHDKKHAFTSAPETLFNELTKKYKLVPSFDAGGGYALIHRFPGNKEDIFIAHLDFLYKIDNANLYLDNIVFDFSTQLPQYIDKEETMHDILDLIFEFIGTFTLFELYSQKEIEIKTEEDLDTKSTFIVESFKEAYNEYTEATIKIYNEANTKKVFSAIEKYPELLRIFLYTTYLGQLHQANALTIEKADDIGTKVINIIEAQKKDLQAPLLLTFMMYYKNFGKSYIYQFSPEFIIGHYIPLLMKMPKHLESVQLLKTDVALFMTYSKNYEKFKDSLTEVMEDMEEHKSSFLLFPEIRSLHNYVTTGDYKKSLNIYYNASTKLNSLVEIRKQYDLYEPANLIHQFNQTLIKNTYVPKLTFLEKLQYIPVLWGLQPHDTKKSIAVLLGIAGVVISTILWAYYSYFDLLSNPSVTAIASGFLTADSIVGIFGVSIMLGVFMWIIYLTTKVIADKIYKSSFPTIAKKILKAVVYSVGISLSLFLILVQIAVISRIFKEEVTAVGRYNVYLGLETYSFAEIKKITLDRQDCPTRTRCMYSGNPKITLELKNGKTDEVVVGNFDDNATQLKSYCTIFTDLEKEARANGVEVVKANVFTSVFTSVCGNRPIRIAPTINPVRPTE